MTTYTAPVADTEFLLSEVLDIGRYSHLPVFSEASPDIIKAVLVEAGRFAEEVLLPLNASGDREGCRFDAGNVSTPEGYREAYGIMTESGWPGLIASPDHGGQGLPRVLGAAFNEFVTSANMAFGLYPGLSAGAYEALLQHGTEEQKALYLPKLASGAWTGTMNLTEPHCGTDLGLLRTKAVPRDDGSYALTGTKIFISAGEHDLTDNIVHLVLARIEGAPEGSGGISLFVVPKRLPDENGEAGAANGVTCGSIEEKMGIHGNATCVMNYQDAQGWLVGEENGGLRAMFTFMNEARLAVGVQGLAMSEVAYQNAASYARERLQGRALGGAKNPDEAADPIIVHPDIRRMLLNMKSFNEAGRALVMWTALRASVALYSDDEDERRRAADHMGLITPVVKGVLTDTGFANTVLAQQVFGGSGYIAETGIEQFVRDARIAMIYEGANGIQALDLVGRKLPANGGRALMGFFADVDGFLKANESNGELAPFTGPLHEARDDLERATGWLMQNALGNPEHAGAASHDYMHLTGLVAMGLMWGMMAKSAAEGLARGGEDDDFYRTKLITGRYFMERLLPETAAHLKRIETGAECMMQLEPEQF
ncbi:MAG: acyl-CoA dehydrogenase [Hyphomicrobiales bacterium]|nr:MAG: acyl-CoA dehydrogenase [Hyphomicrobiales bacterium]